MHLHVLVTDEVDQFSPVLCMAGAVMLADRDPSQVLHVLRTASSAKRLPSAQELCTWREETLSLNQTQYRTHNEGIVLPFVLSPPETGPCLKGKTESPWTEITGTTGQRDPKQVDQRPAVAQVSIWSQTGAFPPHPLLQWQLCNFHLLPKCTEA